MSDVYEVRLSQDWDTWPVASFRSFDIALEFAKQKRAALADRCLVSIANTNSEDCEGPMWDGEDVVTNYDSGLTDDERFECEDAGLAC